MRIFTELLKPLYDATNELNGEKVTTISKVIPMIQILFNYYEEDRFPEDDDATLEHKRVFRTKNFESLKKRFAWTEKNKLYGISTLMDPRFKNVCFTPMTYLAVKEWLIKELSEENNDDTVEVEEEVYKEPAYKKRSLSTFWEAFDMNVSSKPAKEETFKTIHEAELKRYLSYPMLKRDSDPLAWWIGTGMVSYPNLFRIAMKHLIIPATSVPSERVFSLAGQIITERRNRLDPDMANMLIMLHQNVDMI